MTTIRKADLIQSVADALQFISYYHPLDYIEHLGRAYEREPGAYWLRLGPAVEHRRTPYDTRAAVEAFHALGYPDADGMVPEDDPDEVAAMFEAGAEAALAPESLCGL